MKKSGNITLTVLAAMGMTAVQAQVSVADPNNCDEIRRAAQAAGKPVPQACLVTAHHGFSGVLYGGFGATAQKHQGGG